MATSQTSSLSSARLAGLFDELVKISEAQSNKEKAKQWMKNTALIAAGAGAGTGAGMLVERFAKKNIGPMFAHADPRTKAMILGALAGGGSIAASLLAKKLYEERKKRE